ncbi:MAG: IS66 family transposase [Alphaproteobacteria bacterium]|nr:IS66 family transposase [Alphaproteobacteria bacterium]
MLQIETERDIERLRQVALLQEAEIHRLLARLAELTRQLAEARGEDVVRALQLELTVINEQLAARNRALYGTSSERRARGDAGNGGKAKAPQSGHPRRAQRDLPIVEVVHELDEADKACPKCGGDLAAWAGQFEEADEIDVIERSFRIVRHKRQKYRCGCGECIETALGAQKLVPGGRYSVDFAVEVAVAKYLEHMPLARQVRQMAREGLVVDTQTLWDQLFALYGHLVPTYDAILRQVLDAPVIGADETRWRLMDEKGSTKWWAWSVCSPEAVAYRIFPERSTDAGAELLAGYRGIVVCDGYAVYPAVRERLARDGASFTIANCWAHARRGFVEAESAYPKAREVIELIGKLYEVEARASEKNLDLGELRRTESAPIVAEIKRWLSTTVATPKSSLGKAILYALELWPELELFLTDARIPIDNNATERGIRGLAVGRKNHYGSRSERGTKVAALFYTLIESAKLAGVNPKQYLREATRRAIATPAAVTLPRDGPAA